MNPLSIETMDSPLARESQLFLVDEYRIASDESALSFRVTKGSINSSASSRRCRAVAAPLRHRKDAYLSNRFTTVSFDNHELHDHLAVGPWCAPRARGLAHFHLYCDWVVSLCVVDEGFCMADTQPQSSDRPPGDVPSDQFRVVASDRDERLLFDVLSGCSAGIGLARPASGRSGNP